ncbi:hypothetical protein ABAC460_03320 [Asticcacaulis sp. AC460]|uniref:response regulator transcription factor n=1 Tax=Asticcacaulis sp. AC460 TaxID=1282360 RepID=UPI0003C3B8A9|nr:response regulator transcription factor [Asticcacaulis sp. AC460]ESQ91941.1 hypothetical protein ABAC460_03320 [Asticcacaulis sp. AC460]
MGRILLIDDHPLFCDGFSATCGALRPQFEIACAASIGQAITVLDREGPPNCILVDLALPDGSGFDALGILARRDPLTPRVIISGRDDPAARARALSLGASGFISKSQSPQAIMAALDIILSGGLYFDEPPVGDALTLRQLEVLELLAEGCANKEIETRLGLAERTVRAHLTEIFRALGVTGRVKAVMAARARGLVP